MTYYQAEYQSPMGNMTIVSDGAAIVGVWFEGQKYFMGSLKKKPITENRPELTKTIAWLNDYFQGKQPDPKSLPLNPIGTPFRKQVWNTLLTIPYGSLMTYGDIAKAIAKPGQTMSAQAVGSAVGHNPISVIIPCHRVVGTDGSLTGYAGGLQIKIDLLAHEKVDMTKLYRPHKGTAL